MLGDYRNLHIELNNAGLDLVHPPDRVPAGKWTILTNVRSTQETILSTREGADLFFDLLSNAPILAMRRIDAFTIVSQSGGTLYRNVTPISTGWSTLHPATMVRYSPPLTNDTWMYLTDGTKMRKIKSDGTDFKWGITAPIFPAAFIVNGTGGLDSSVTNATTYDWRFRYRSSITGAISNPSPTVAGIAAVGAAVDVTVTASTDPQVDTIDIFRRGGTLPTVWNLIISLNNSTQIWNDAAADADIFLNEQLSVDNDVPFTTLNASGGTVLETVLPFVWGPFIGRYIFGVGDPVRPNFVYWTNSESADTAASTNNLQVSGTNEPLIAGFIYGSNSYVWSRDNLYTLDYGGPTSTPTFQPRLVPLGIGLAARYGFTANGPGGVFFLSKDGIYVTDCMNSLNVLTQDIRPIFRGVTVGSYSPVDFSSENDIQMEYCGMELHFLYRDTVGVMQHIFYDILLKRWQHFEVADHDEMVCYSDENQPGYRLLMGEDDGHVLSANVPGVLTDHGGVPIFGAARTNSFDCDIPLTMKEFGVALVDIDTQTNNVVFTPYFNAEVDPGNPTTITTNGRTIVPISLGDVYARSVGFDFTWAGQVKLYAIELLWREDEENLQHWEMPPTTLGLSGWKHIRDGYVGIRSNADVTMTLSVDGVVHTYVLASTGGERRSVYVKLDPTRGKVFQWQFNSTADFRLYGEDTYFNVKEWQTGLGYKPVSPFPSQGLAPFLRRESGT